MTTPTRYQRIRLDFSSPWNLGGKTVQEWSQVFNLSGSTSLVQADGEATALDLAAPTLKFAHSHTSLIAWSHYPIGSTVADYGNTYAIGVHPGDGTAYTGGTGSGNSQQLEVAVLARCPVKRSATGKQVYLRKWCHDVMGGSDPNAVSALASQATTFSKWNNGAGPRLLVPVDPTSGEQGSGWTAELHLFTRQLRKTPKRRLKLAGNSVDIPPVDPVP